MSAKCSKKQNLLNEREAQIERERERESGSEKKGQVILIVLCIGTVDKQM